jgi:hypothetical protein
MMLRKLSIAVLPAVLLTMGVFNWCTTCCCANSMILEILHGSCEHHGEEHEGPSHPNHDPLSCHKQGGGDFLVAADPDIQYSPAVASIPIDPTPVVFWTLRPLVADWTIPRGAPPDIPLVTQRWLI